MKKSTFHISKMDCPSEENLIRMKLDGQAIQKLDFDIPNRRLSVYHEGNIQPIDEALKDLKLGSLLENTIEAEIQNTQTDHRKEKQLLWSVLLINFGFFVEREHETTTNKNIIAIAHE